jgi:DNA relaxase NicK
MNTITIDYVTFVWDTKTVSEAIHALGLSASTWTTKAGHYPYAHIQRAGNISIAYDNYNERGVFVTLTSQGCREFETFSSIGWADLFGIIRGGEGHTTRLDIAFDDRTGVLNMQRMKHDRDVANYRSLLSYTAEHRSHKENIMGMSLYFGAKGSNTNIRIYDKDAEQGGLGTHWIRVELQLRDAYADTVVKSGLSIPCIFSSVLKKYLVFLQPNPTDSNKCRWPVAPYWNTLLEGAQTLTLSCHKDTHSNGQSRITNLQNVLRSFARDNGWVSTADIVCKTAHNDGYPLRMVRSEHGASA